ncbi:MAG: type II toxin-antitoxin system RelE/ParE family toxin [Coriobacteriia bacterium]|nr:type II toxin-antitoxin system RelE/ParE family toxin [Coriobacteriia bacterium]
MLTSGTPYSIDYFNRRVLDEIESWPVGILADYMRLIELLAEFGPGLRMPHSRAMGDGLFELRPRGCEGIGRALYCYATGRRVVVLHAFTKKRQAISDRDVVMARKRMREVDNG